MQTMSIAEAKNQPSNPIHAVEQGEEVVLTRHGRPAEHLVADFPISHSQTAPHEVTALAQLEAVRQQLRGKATLVDIRALRDEGRRF